MMMMLYLPSRLVYACRSAISTTRQPSVCGRWIPSSPKMHSRSSTSSASCPPPFRCFPRWMLNCASCNLSQVTEDTREPCAVRPVNYPYSIPSTDRWPNQDFGGGGKGEAGEGSRPLRHFAWGSIWGAKIRNFGVCIAMCFSVSLYLLCPRPLSDDARLTFVCLTSVSSVAYIGPKSRTERSRKTKIGTEVATSHVTRTPRSRSKGQRSTCRGRDILWRPLAQLVFNLFSALRMDDAGWSGGTTDLCPGRQKPSRCHCRIWTPVLSVSKQAYHYKGGPRQSDMHVHMNDNRLLLWSKANSYPYTTARKELFIRLAAWRKLNFMLGTFGV